MSETVPLFVRCAALVAALASPAPSQQTLLGVSYQSGALWEISTVDAGATLLVPTLSIPFVGDLLVGPDGNLYGLKVGAGSSLYRIDPIAGSAVLVGPLGIDVGGGGLVVSSSGIVYGFQGGTFDAPFLFRVDLATGAASAFVPMPGEHIISGAVYRSDGVLVGLDRQQQALVSIDTTTGATSVLHPVSGTLAGPGGMTTAGGVTYFTTANVADVKELWTVDLFTGALTRVGTIPSYTGSGPLTQISGIVPGVTTGSTFCFGDWFAACPCGNTTNPARRSGCAHSGNAGGALRGLGTASVTADTLVLLGVDLTNGPGLYYHGTSTLGGGNGLPFGDGLRCAGGTVVRIGTQVGVAGSSRYPGPGDVSVSVRGAVAAGATHHYQLWFRNAATFCTPDTFNLTNGLTITWGS